MRLVDVEHNFKREHLIAYFEYCFKSNNSYNIIQVLDSVDIINEFRKQGTGTREVYSDDVVSIDYIDTNDVGKYIVSCKDLINLENSLKTFHSKCKLMDTLINQSLIYNSSLYSKFGATLNQPVGRNILKCNIYASVVSLCSIVSNLLNLNYIDCSFEVSILHYDKCTSYVDSDVYTSIIDGKLYYNVSDVCKNMYVVSIICADFIDNINKCILNMYNNLKVNSLELDRLKFISNRNIPINYI